MAVDTSIAARHDRAGSAIVLQRLGRWDDRPPREVIEESLAHSLSAVEAAYKRRPMLMRRRSLMADWATFLVRPCAEALAEWEKTLNAVPKREVLIRLSRVAMANPEPFIFPGDQTRDE